MRVGRSNCPAARSKRRVAFTLLEMVITLSTLLLLAIAASSLLEAITDVGLRHRRTLEERRTILRLADVFRQDVHGAASVEIAPAGWPLRLVHADRSIAYRWHPSSRQLDRLVRSDTGSELTASDPTDSTPPSKSLLAADVFQLSDRCDPKLVEAERSLTVVLRQTGAIPAWTVEAQR